MLETEKRILPEFPRTMHLPLEPNASSDDCIASLEELSWLLGQNISITEKIDGANCGISIYNNEPLIRNRTKILNKNYQAKGKAKTQFVPIWSWFYENKNKFKSLEKELGFMPSVYGEWLPVTHTVHYNKIPDLFVAFDIFDPHTQLFLDPKKSRELLLNAGFNVVPLIAEGNFTVEKLLQFRNGPSEFSSENLREGIYLKTGNGETLTSRYKMVAPWFKSDDNWAKNEIKRNAKSV